MLSAENRVTSEEEEEGLTMLSQVVWEGFWKEETSELSQASASQYEILQPEVVTWNPQRPRMLLAH